MLSVRKEDFLEDLIDEVADTTQRKRGKYPNTFQNQFTNRRINAKYIELANRYAQFTDDDEIFGQMVAIILELVKDKEYIKISKTGRNDEISWIITTAEQRMWDYIQKNYTMNFVKRDGDSFVLDNNFVSFNDDGNIESSRIVYFDDYTYIGGGNFISNHEIYKVGDCSPTEYEHLLGLRKLDELLNRCKLTQSQKDVVLALESTRDSSVGTYNISRAAEMLGKSQSNVSVSWSTIKTKIINTLNSDYEFDNLTLKTIHACEDLLEYSDTYVDVLNWLKLNIKNQNIIDCLYEIESQYRQTLIRAIQDKPVEFDDIRPAVRHFLKEIHLFLRKHTEMHK